MPGTRSAAPSPACSRIPALARCPSVVAASGAGSEIPGRSAPDSPRIGSASSLHCPIQAWARLLSSSSIALVTLKEAASETAIPSKTFSAMAAGNAVVAVAPAGSGLAAVVARERCGAVVSPGDVDGLVHALRGLALDPEALRAWRGIEVGAPSRRVMTSLSSPADGSRSSRRPPRSREVAVS